MTASASVAGAVAAALMVTLVLQGITLAVARPLGRRRLFLGWGIGAALRFAMLPVYAFLILPALGLPGTAGLVALGVLLFISVLIEPLLLQRVVR